MKAHKIRVQTINELRLRRDWALRKLEQFEVEHQGTSHPEYSTVSDRARQACEAYNKAERLLASKS